MPQLMEAKKLERLSILGGLLLLFLHLFPLVFIA